MLIAAPRKYQRHGAGTGSIEIVQYGWSFRNKAHGANGAQSFRSRSKVAFLVVEQAPVKVHGTGNLTAYRTGFRRNHSREFPFVLLRRSHVYKLHLGQVHLNMAYGADALKRRCLLGWLAIQTFCARGQIGRIQVRKLAGQNEEIFDTRALQQPGQSARIHALPFIEDKDAIMLLHSGTNILHET